MKKILITGGSGYVAKNIYKKFEDKHDIFLLTREDCDLTNPTEVFNWFEGRSFDAVVHTAVTGGRRTNTQNSGKPTPSPSDVLDQNLLMYYNLLECKPFYNKFIQLGSGMEGSSDTNNPYALSKTVIANSMAGKDNFHNIRIFATFDENEQNDRFIKSNLIRYINRKDMVMHHDKKMDFFYMEDLVSVVGHFIEKDGLPKRFDCTYEQTKSLSEIADIINNLGDHTANVPSDLEEQEDYCGHFSDLGLKYVGLELGIENVYHSIMKRDAQRLGRAHVRP